MKALLAIPARLAANRLPGKPLARIGDAPMIVHCWRCVQAAALGPVVVAAADAEIVAAVHAVGGRAVLTDPAHQSGTDRVLEAVRSLDPDGVHDVIINVQGDTPFLDPALLRAVIAPLSDPAVDIATIAAPTTDPDDRHRPQVVKVIAGFGPPRRSARALAFTRAAAPWGDGPLYHHIGIYAYRRAALERFAAAPPSILEQREKLEQMRALDIGLRLDVALVDAAPLGVDVPEDLARARALYARMGNPYL